MNRALIAVVLSLALTGCATPPQRLYEWGSYQRNLWSYFKGESPEKQILDLEEHLEKSRGAGASLPPGFHAHLGLLYSKTGNSEKMLEHFRLEEASFPESRAFLEQLTKRSVEKK